MTQITGITVVTRTKERPQQLARSLDSLLEQSRRPDTWSVVNDGGDREAVQAIVARAQEAGLKTVCTHLETNRGRAAAANVGVRAEPSQAILLLDDDDRLLPDAINTLGENLAAAPTADVAVSGQVWLVEERQNKSGKWEPASRVISNPERGPVRLVDLAYRNFVPVNGLLYRRSVFDEVGGYDEDLPVLEDWDFLLKIIMLGDIAKIDLPVGEYFIRPELDDQAETTANSVTASHHLHEEFEVRLRNRYLRDDLRAGRVGLGHLMNPSHRLPMERINAAADGLNRAARRNWVLRRFLKLARGG